MTSPTITKIKLDSLFEEFRKKKIMVIGDVMLDAYWWGQVNRVSPEAPVPVVLMNKKEYRLGGAANVALNLRKMGATPYLVSVVGEDNEGSELIGLLKRSGISGDYIIKSTSRPTTVKTRIIGNNSQQLIRVDSESLEDIDEKLKDLLKKHFNSIIDSLDAIVFEDYDKGLLDDGLIEYIIGRAKTKNIPTIVDPKKKNFFSYAQCTLFKPNLKELKEGMKTEISSPVNREELRIISRDLIEKTGIEMAMITLADEGIYICNLKEDFITASHKRSVFDVSGAGDTVASIAALACSCGQDIRMIAELSNIAGGLVCEKTGVVPIDADEFLTEATHLLT